MLREIDVSHLSLKIEGALAPREVMDALSEVVVEASLHLPSMATLRFVDHDMQLLQAGTFDPGKKIEIFYGPRSQDKLFTGKVAGLEPDLDILNPTLIVRCFALSHKLYRGRHSRVFLNMSDADIARKLASEAGLSVGSIDSTSPIYEHVYQHNQTDAEFLLERARLLGYELWIEDTRLHFRKPTAGGAPVQLKWGEDLTGFRPRLSTAEQVNEVEVRGWDPKRKQEIVGRATRGNGAPQIGIPQPGAAIAQQAWGQAKMAIVNQLVVSAAHATTLAQAKLDELASAFVEAEGTCAANGQIAPGRQVQIQGVGSRFEGTYYVTSVTHTWSQSQGMMTHFTASGRRDRSMWSLLEESASPRMSLGMGLVIGIVTNNKDPEELGRVKVKFPWLSDEGESAWARIMAPMAGQGRGFFYLPEVDDEVLVGFEQGDFQRPVILGMLWNGVDKPPMNAAEAVGGDGKVNKRVLKSRSGHIITLDDTQNSEQIVVKSKAGHTITLNDTSGGEEITIIDKTGNNKIVVHSPDNSMQIKAQGNLTIESGANITIKAQGNIEMSGQANVDVKAQAQLKVSGQAGAEMSTPAVAKVSGQGSVEVSSAGAAKLQGSLVNIQGSGPVAVTGTPIKLN
jgi:uncharacterized protein involved in type VI secretion and phage assembly